MATKTQQQTPNESILQAQKNENIDPKIKKGIRV